MLESIPMRRDAYTMEGGIAIYRRLWVILILCYLFHCVVLLYSYHKSRRFMVDG